MVWNNAPIELSHVREEAEAEGVVEPAASWVAFGVEVGRGVSVAGRVGVWVGAGVAVQGTKTTTVGTCL